LLHQKTPDALYPSFDIPAPMILTKHDEALVQKARYLSDVSRFSAYYQPSELWASTSVMRYSDRYRRIEGRGTIIEPNARIMPKELLGKRSRGVSSSAVKNAASTVQKKRMLKGPTSSAAMEKSIQNMLKAFEKRETISAKQEPVDEEFQDEEEEQVSDDSDNDYGQNYEDDDEDGNDAFEDDDDGGVM